MNWLCRWFGWGCPPDASLPASQVGLCVGNTAGNPDLIDAAADTGIGWVRLDLYWPNTEPEPGVYDWWISEDVERALSLGLNVYLTLHGSPAWATDGEPWTGVPDLGAWRSFVQAAVERFPEVEVWGVWNEPNAPQFFDGDVKDYVEMLRAASGPIRASGSRVAAPDLATADWTNPIPFLRSVRQEVEQYIDILSVHYYGTSSDARRFIEGLNSSVPVWLTETSHGHYRNEEEQANQLREVFRKQNKVDCWEVTMPYHWYADPPYIIKNTETEQVIRETIQSKQV